ncbi:hypothetical protein LINPERPRIM_LOCUS20589 [Linum perenne]
MQIDSIWEVKLLSMTTYLDCQHATIVCQYRRLLERNWNVTLKHIYREANHFVDVLANRGHGTDLGTRTIECSDNINKHEERYDLMRELETRLIFM